MNFVEIVLSILMSADLFVWWRSSRTLGCRVHRGVRWGLHVFFAIQTASFAFVIWSLMHRYDLPMPYLIFVYLWHIVVLPLAFTGNLLGLVGKIVTCLFRFVTRKPAAPVKTPETGLSRREFLGTLAALTPPLLTFPLSVYARSQLDAFRIRPMEIALPSLPVALDGMTIALLADLHIGAFTPDYLLKEIVTATNNLNADLTLFAGDLINSNLGYLSQAFETLRGLRGPLVLCEGNHDVGLDRAGFEHSVKSAGFCLLLDETVTHRVRGVPVQILGLRWGGPQNWQHRHDQRNLFASVDSVLAQRDPAAFPILLAHHPHAWDHCRDIPLTLSGHTHGGQFMIDEQHGFGPLMFHYWSGLYTRPADSMHPAQALVVSNGVGNWFPLRTKAPAEIVHITLRRG